MKSQEESLTDDKSIYMNSNNEAKILKHNKNNTFFVDPKNFKKIDYHSDDLKNLKFYPDDIKDEIHYKIYNNKPSSKFYDPCNLSRQASINCILRNQNNKKECQEYFDAYKECKNDFFVNLKSRKIN